VTAVEHDGHEYVLLLAGANSLAATPHGDHLWLFSLDGTAESLPGIEKGASTGGVDHFDPNGKVEGATGAEPGAEAEATPTGGTKHGGDIAAGETLFGDNCSVCHGLSGQGGNGGPPITSQRNIDAIMAQIEQGGGGMPPFGDQLSDQEILDIATYVAQSIGGGGK
jgi:mono/diheme cytochrome c family protein